MINKLFDAIGKAITSLAAVIFVMLMTITGMILFSHTLFANIFPVGMEQFEKKAATWFMALGWEFTVLITTCNTKHIGKRVPAIMAICSGIIVLFFIQAFDGQQSILILAQRWFVGLLAATINYIYADLFYAKWIERHELVHLPARVEELEKDLQQSERACNQLERELNESNDLLEETRNELVKLQRLHKAIVAELTCKHCNVKFEAYGALRAHMGHCKMNPKNN